MMGVYVNPTHVTVVDLPMGFGWSETDPKPPYLTVEISGAQIITIEGQVVILDQLSASIREKNLEWPTILVIADPDAPYELLVKTLGEITKAGVEQSEICFGDLSSFQLFHRVEYDTSGQFRRVDAIAPSGCEQFFDRSTFWQT